MSYKDDDRTDYSVSLGFGKSASDNGIFERGVKRRKAERDVIEAAEEWLPWAKSRMFLCRQEVYIVKALEALTELKEKE